LWQIRFRRRIIGQAAGAKQLFLLGLLSDEQQSFQTTTTGFLFDMLPFISAKIDKIIWKGTENSLIVAEDVLITLETDT